MSPCSIKIALLCFFAAVAAGILAVTGASESPLGIRIVSMGEMETKEAMTVEFQRRDPAARFSQGDLRVQVRIAGRWQPPERFPESDYPDLLARTNCQRVVFSVARQAEACRFIIGYRSGGSPRCRAYGFLWRHGVSKNFPKFASTVLKCVPQQRSLRHVKIELMIPCETQNLDAPPAGKPWLAGIQDG